MTENGRELASGLRSMHQATARAGPSQVFQALARSWAEALGASHGWIGEVEVDRPGYLRAVGSWGERAEQPRVAVAATPLERVLEADAAVHDTGFAHGFPADGALIAHDLDGYVATRLATTDGEVLGVLLACDRQPIAPLPHLDDLAQVFAVRATLELSRRRAEEALRRDTAMAESLATIAMHLNDHLDEGDAMLSGLCAKVTRALGVDAAHVFDLDAAGAALVLRAHHGSHPAFAAASPAILRDTVETIWPEPGSEVVVDDPTSNARMPDLELYQRIKVRTIVTAACWRGGRVFGLLSLHMYSRQRTFTPGELAFVRAVAGQLASSLAALTAQRALRKSEAQYRQIVTTCLEGLWVVDEAGRTSYVNPQLTRMLGYTAQEMFGREVFAFMDAQAQPAAELGLERQRRGISERVDARFKHKQGHDVWTVLASSAVTDERGTFGGAVMLLTDVTERRGYELKFQQAQKLESLGVLAGGIAHDFNNILVGVLGNVGLAMADVPKDSPALPPLRDIQASALRAADLTKQMLAYSGRGRFVVERLEINAVMTEMRQLLESVVAKRALLEFKLGPQVSAIEADASQLRQVLVNLVSNACDALSGPDGVITVSTGELDADSNYLASTYLDESLSAGRYAFVEVTDGGAGMDEETQRKIFDPFYTTKFPGRGLGLAAVLGILRGHRGAIKVHSEVDRGSSFKVLFPCDMSAREPTASAAAPTPTARGQTLTVLVVDDEPAVRNVARRVLEKLGYHTVLASDGREAISVFTESASDIDVVLLDMTMPGASGEEVFRELRRLRPEVRVVLTSGYTEADATARFVGTGLAGFVQKPWRPQDLSDAIARAIRPPAA